MDSKLKPLECPFTWGLVKQWARDFDEMDEPDVEFDEEPLLAFIRSIMISYFRAEKEDYAGAFANFKVTDDIWEKIEKSQLEYIRVSANVLFHIKIATEYFVHDLAMCKAKAERLLKSLESSESFQSANEVATIDGCKSVAWSSFHERGNKKCTEFAKLAISNNPKCPLWHYMLGKSLRLSRREIFGNLIPLDEEEAAIVKSCELSDTPFYKIRLAQMYREKKDFFKSKEIYLELYSANPKSSSILLRLAMGFMSECKDFYRARKCLEEAGKYKQNCMYHHYFGVFYTKQKRFGKAVEHYEKAAILGNNFKSDLQYAHAQQKTEKNFDFIQQLESMLIKYGDTNLKHKQQILLHIGMRYYFKKQNTGKSLNYLLQAIEVNPENQQLMTFCNATVNWEFYNIYDFVSKLLQKYQWHESETATMKQDALKKLEEYCKKYRDAQFVQSIEKITLHKTS